MNSSQTSEKLTPGRGRPRGTGSVYRPRDPKNRSRHLKTWWIAYYVNGKRYRESSRSRNRSDANAFLKRRQGEHASGRFIGLESGRLIFEDLEAGIVTSYELAGRRSIGRLKAAFGHLRARFGGMRALDITPSRLQAYAVERSTEAAPATVQYELALLRRAFTLAVQQGRLPSRPAFPQIRVNNARIGFFSSAEFEAVVQELPVPLKNVAVFGYYTGWRKSEILGLTWGAVDLEKWDSAARAYLVRSRHLDQERRRAHVPDWRAAAAGDSPSQPASIHR